jgi:hypothetical protein
MVGWIEECWRSLSEGNNPTSLGYWCVDVGFCSAQPNLQFSKLILEDISKLLLLPVSKL